MKDNPTLVRLRFLKALILLLILPACRGEASITPQPPRRTAPPASASVSTEAVVSVPTPISQVTQLPTPTIAAGFPTSLSPNELPPTEPTGAELQASAVPACIDGLTYLEDITVPDGTVVSSNVPIDKRWRVKNSGTCNWNRNYRITLISGTDLGLPDQQALFPARSGNEAVVRMLLTAPKDPGTYRSAWQAIDPSGAPFGDPIYIEITVGS